MVQKRQHPEDAAEHGPPPVGITPTLVHYETVKKWNGQLPQVSGGATPLIRLPTTK